MATRTTTKKAELKTSTAKPATEKEAPAKLAAEPETKEPVKATVTEKKAVEVFVQWLGKEIYAKDVVDSIKKIWTEEMGKKESELEDLRVYIKPEDNGAHYVINGDITGFLGL